MVAVAQGEGIEAAGVIVAAGSIGGDGGAYEFSQLGDFAAAHGDIGMAGENLLDQRGSAARHADDEDRPPAAVGGAREAVQLLGSVVSQAAIDPLANERGVVWPATDVVGGGGMVERVIVPTEAIEQPGGGEVQHRAVRRQVNGAGKKVQEAIEGVGFVIEFRGKPGVERCGAPGRAI